ncbi:unnamed protein product [Porites lobata]|uniref:Reverse transcriptase domain-containing protein n=1 Tax=Porites lobata TaxID=104759 RepID=A0ABN8S2G6_9CNID|nr:unnamed protein product [Porites lobata]
MHQAKFVNDIDYAGEICLLESSIERAQVQLSLTAEPAASFGLLINTSKTEYMYLNCPGNQKLKTVMSNQLKFFGHILRFEKDKPADFYTLQMMIMMISGMPGKSDGGQNANGVGQGICLFSLFSRTKRTMPLIS